MSALWRASSGIHEWVRGARVLVFFVARVAVATAWEEVSGNVVQVICAGCHRNAGGRAMEAGQWKQGNGRCCRAVWLHDVAQATIPCKRSCCCSCCFSVMRRTDRVVAHVGWVSLGIALKRLLQRAKRLGVQRVAADWLLARRESEARLGLGWRSGVSQMRVWDGRAGQGGDVSLRTRVFGDAGCLCDRQRWGQRLELAGCQ